MNLCVHDLLNVTKLKQIRPCVHQIEAKMRVNLVVLVVTETLTFLRLRSISPKFKEIEILIVVY